MMKKCDACLKKLNASIKYVPGMGESCTSCLINVSSVWRDAAHNSRSKLIVLS